MDIQSATKATDAQRDTMIMGLCNNIFRCAAAPLRCGTRSHPGHRWTLANVVLPCSLLFLLILASLSALNNTSGLKSKSSLVLYVYSATDPEYINNLRFFVAHGMHEEDGCDYIIIVQGSGFPSDLPRLPDNAHYVYHKNVCYDWGTFGWVLSRTKAKLENYKTFIFMNSSVRGPFLPPYWPVRDEAYRRVQSDTQASYHWSRILASKLNDKVKLVGSTISCEPAHANGEPFGLERHNAHVQSYVVATDQVGLRVLMDDHRVFHCHISIGDAVYDAEVGASSAIFNAGFTIDSLMIRYQGVDWTDKRNWNCNARLNPYAEKAYDGIDLNPLEVLFVKMKAFQKEAAWAYSTMATRYDRWLASQGQAGVINSNEYHQSPMRFRFGKILQMQLRGRACFDFKFYRHLSPDIPDSDSDERLWEDFVLIEQFSGRQFRFLCKSPFLEEIVVTKLVQWHSRMISAQTFDVSRPWNTDETHTL